MRLSMLTLVYRAVQVQRDSITTFNKDCVSSARTALECHQEFVMELGAKSSFLVSVYINWYLLAGPRCNPRKLLAATSNCVLARPSFLRPSSPSLCCFATSSRRATWRIWVGCKYLSNPWRVAATILALLQNIIGSSRSFIVWRRAIPS